MNCRMYNHGLKCIFETLVPVCSIKWRWTGKGQFRKNVMLGKSDLLFKIT